MPPKKAAAKGNVKPEGTLSSGIAEESCQLPLWDDNEIVSENWGGELSVPQVDASMQFVDGEFSSTLESCFSGVIHGWKRPTAIFSPFKPMVFRPQPQVLQFGNPYTCNVAALDRESIEDGGEVVESLSDVIALYRRMRAIVVPNPAEGGGAGGASATSLGNAAAESAADTSPVASRRRVRRRQYKGDPSLMRAYNSALLVLAQNQAAVPQGRYAWELIHPQSQATGFPIYNPWGKYAVKLFFRGAYRKIVVDDRLPVDSNSDSILSVTDQKEIWPALILKAMLKALGPQYERRVLEDPILILSCLLGGSMPERVHIGLKEMRLADAVRRHAAANFAISSNPQCAPNLALGGGVVGGVALNNPIVVTSGGGTASMGGTTISAGGAMAPPLPSNTMTPSLASLHPHHAGGGGGAMLVNKLVLVVTVRANRAAQLGLEPDQLYNVMESRQYQNTLALRLCGQGGHWRGKFAYSSPSWTAEVEDTLRFDPNIHRSRHELAKQWNDFWVPWEDFVEEFQFAYLLHPVAQDPQAYGNFKQLAITESSVASSAPPSKPLRETPRLSAAAAAATAAAHATANSQQQPDPNAPTVKWLALKARTDTVTDMVMVLLGFGRPVVLSGIHAQGALPTSVAAAPVSGGYVPPPLGGAFSSSPAAVLSNTTTATINNGGSPVRGGSLGGGSASNVTATSPINNNTASSVRFVSASGPAGHPTYDQTPFSVAVERYRWRDSGPFTSIVQYRGPWDPYATFPFVVPQSSASSTTNSTSNSTLGATSGTQGGGSGETILMRVTVRGLPPDTAISFLGATEFTLGDEKDVLKDMGIYTATDAGRYGEHEPNNATIWFKRWFAVKTPTTANFYLKTVPRHIDITPYKMVLTDSTQPKTKGGAPNKAGGSAGGAGGRGAVGGPLGSSQHHSAANNGSLGGGGTPMPPSAPQSPIPMDEEAEELSVIQHASLCLLDLDSGEPVAKDHLAQILQAKLEPNKLGYILVASACSPVSRAAGKWRLRITSNAPIEGVEQRSTEELHLRSGEYRHSTNRTIFSYNITTAELATASLQLTLHGAPPTVAFVVRIKQGEKTIEEMATNRCFIPHITLTPADKTSSNVTKLTAVLETEFAEQQEEARLAAVGERYEADVEAQEERALGLRDELLDAYVEDGELPTSNGHSAGADGAAAPSSPSTTALDGGAPTPTKGAASPPPGGDRSSTPSLAPASLLSPAAVAAAPSSLIETASKLATTLNASNDSFGLSFTVRIHASSARVDVHEDTSAADAINAVKVSWAKRELTEGLHHEGGTGGGAKSGGGAGAGGAGGQSKGGGKAGNKSQGASHDDATGRAAKAREARLRFLANPTSVFIPFAGPYPTPHGSAAIGGAGATAAPRGGSVAGGRSSSSQVTYTDASTVFPTPTPGGGLPYGMSCFSSAAAAGGDYGINTSSTPIPSHHQNTSSSITSSHPSAPNNALVANGTSQSQNSINWYFSQNPASYKIAPTAPISADELRTQREAAAAEVAEKSGSLPATTVPNTAQHKSALMSILAKVEERLSEQAARRRDAFMSASSILTAAYDIKPQTTEVEDDKKKKKR